MGVCRMELTQRNSQIKMIFNVKGVLRDAKTGKVKDTFYGKNMAVDDGLESLASRLSGTDDPTTKGTILYCGLGTDSTAVTANDTDLGTETVRKLITTRSSTGKTAKFKTFFNTSEGNVTIREIGLFGDDATAVADSGTLFCRLIVNKTKTSSETLTLEWDVTFSDDGV